MGKMLWWSLGLGRVFGAKVSIHWSVPLLLAVLVFVGGGGLVLCLGLMMSIFIHELAHLLAGKHYGHSASSLTIYALGGLMDFDEETDAWTKGFIQMAAAGPIANLMIALALCPIWHWAHSHHLCATSEWLRGFVCVNVALGVFNLIPAWPLDGGRIFVTVLKRYVSELKAAWITMVVSRIAVVLGFGLCLAMRADRDVRACVFLIVDLVILSSIWYVAGIEFNELMEKEGEREWIG